jgi:hypothetical protein
VPRLGTMRRPRWCIAGRQKNRDACAQKTQLSGRRPWVVGAPARAQASLAVDGARHAGCRGVGNRWHRGLSARFHRRVAARRSGVADTGVLFNDAQHAYARLARERRFAAVDRRLKRRPTKEGQLCLTDELEAGGQRRTFAVQAIALDSIVGPPSGTSKGIRPLLSPAAVESRTVAAAVDRTLPGTSSPPISVYRIGDEHYVRDGHHRVSVARALGESTIEAEVVQLLPAPHLRCERREKNPPGCLGARPSGTGEARPPTSRTASADRRRSSLARSGDPRQRAGMLALGRSPFTKEHCRRLASTHSPLPNSTSSGSRRRASLALLGFAQRTTLRGARRRPTQCKTPNTAATRKMA